MKNSFRNKVAIGAMTAAVLNPITPEATDRAVAEVSQERLDIATRYSGCKILEAATTPGAPEEVLAADIIKSGRNTVNLTLQLTQTEAGMAVEKKYHDDDTIAWWPWHVETTPLLQTDNGLEAHSIYSDISRAPTALTDPLQQKVSTLDLTFYPRIDYYPNTVIGIGVSSEVMSSDLEDDVTFTSSFTRQCGSLVLTKHPDVDAIMTWEPSTLGLPQEAPRTTYTTF